MKYETSEEFVMAVNDQGLDIEEIRIDFPMLQTEVNGKLLVYFDTAATNHKLQVLIDKLQEF
jgi:cysteine desulfurase/selenocysteine lyase